MRKKWGRRKGGRKRGSQRKGKKIPATSEGLGETHSVNGKRSQTNQGRDCIGHWCHIGGRERTHPEDSATFGEGRLSSAMGRKKRPTPKEKHRAPSALEKRKRYLSAINRLNKREKGRIGVLVAKGTGNSSNARWRDKEKDRSMAPFLRQMPMLGLSGARSGGEMKRTKRGERRGEGKKGQ